GREEPLTIPHGDAVFIFRVVCFDGLHSLSPNRRHQQQQGKEDGKETACSEFAETTHVQSAPMRRHRTAPSEAASGAWLHAGGLSLSNLLVRSTVFSSGARQSRRAPKRRPAAQCRTARSGFCESSETSFPEVGRLPLSERACSTGCWHDALVCARPWQP